MGIRFTRLTMQNFMPYFGNHRLDFGQEKPITVIHGQNMWGKTSIISAIRWSWYGVVTDRGDRHIPRLSLINWDAADSGDFTLGTELEFEVDGMPYKISRRIQSKSPTSAPEFDQDFEELLFVEKDGRVINSSDSQSELNMLLHEDASQFFFFDGEKLNEFEQLLIDVDSQASTLRESIEQVLGIPALSNAIDDLSVGRDAAHRRRNTLASRFESVKSLASQAERVKALADNVREDISKLENRKSAKLAEIQTLDDELAGMSSVEADMETQKNLDQQIRDHARDIGSKEEQLRDHLQLAYLDLVQPRVSVELDKLRKQQQKTTESVGRIAELKTQIEQLEGLMSSGSCPVCGHAHEDTADSDLRTKISKLVTKMDEIDFNHEEVGILAEKIRRLSNVRPPGVRVAIVDLESEIRTLSVKRAAAATRRAEIAERLKDHDEIKVADNRREHVEATKQLGILENDLRIQQTELDRLERDHDNYQLKISQADDPALARTTAEVDTYDRLISAFREGLVRLRNQLKEDVEADATEVFLQLTTAEGYEALEINDSYGLNIVRSGGKTVPVRSAGAEQIVALSLISALNRNAVRTAPVVMDTPFGRLDQDHRRNVLNYASKMSEQIILLVHGGEIDSLRDFDQAQGSVDREYMIRRISESQSEITNTRE